MAAAKEIRFVVARWSFYIEKFLLGKIFSLCFLSSVKYLRITVAIHSAAVSEVDNYGRLGLLG